MHKYIFYTFLNVFLMTSIAHSGDRNAEKDFEHGRPPPRESFGEGVEDVKVFTIKSWPFVKDDGQVALTFTNLQVTLLHIKNGDRYRTAARVNFDQYNNTENDKGSHSAYLTIMLIGDAGSTLADPINTSIVRDGCRNMGTMNLGQIDFKEDIYKFVNNIKAIVHLSWNYEGEC